MKTKFLLFSHNAFSCFFLLSTSEPADEATLPSSISMSPHDDDVSLIVEHRHAKSLTPKRARRPAQQQLHQF
jgi:hypothetical protein